MFVFFNIFYFKFIGDSFKNTIINIIIILNNNYLINNYLNYIYSFQKKLSMNPIIASPPCFGIILTSLEIPP